MKPLNIYDVARAVKGSFQNEKCSYIKGVSTDSRTIKPGELFVPLTGPNFNGHDFIGEAFEHGASASLCSNDEKKTVSSFLDNKQIIFVDSVQDALLSLAGYYRSLFDIPFVAITGSVGKTTTKDMIAAVLGVRFNVLKTHGNYNNEIGLPLTLFQLDQKHDICVIEMGMSGLGEILSLANIVNPKVSVITNIGISHIEKLGSKQNIATAKMEILEPLNHDGLAVLNADSPELWRQREKLQCRSIFFGLENGDIIAKDVAYSGDEKISFETIGVYENHKFRLSVPGTHNIYNALAAIAVGSEFGLSPEEISQGLVNFKQYKMRLELKTARSGAIVIDDSYNASPDSVKAALDLLYQKGVSKKKVAVLGDMLELGDYSETAHLDIGRYASGKTDVLVAVGKYAKYLAKGAQHGHLKRHNIHVYDTPEDGLNDIHSLTKDCDIILVKASRGLKFERFVQLLTGGL
jgi:UDP-N-acetylmuramoyl-tripeptide--D-alanyl-D-alanine ligase